jgi:hypothetical protein
MAAIDDFANYAAVQGGPARHAVAVAPNDGVDLTNVTRWIFVGGVGNLTAIMADGTTVLLTAVAAGTLLPLAATRVKATGTTATLIVALW